MAHSISRFDNLITILVVASMLIIFNMASNLIDIYGPTAMQMQQPAVQGYTRPRQATPAATGTPHVTSTPDKKPLAAQEPIEGLTQEQNAMVMHRFEQAAALLHAKQYDYAITALDQVLDIVPNMPEAYVNMGFAYLEMEQAQTARSAFEKAIDLRPNQANAYYGLAAAWDLEEDYEAALGAMRTFIHLSPPDEPFLAKARAAIWEWEGLLGRIPGVEKAPEGAKPQIQQQFSPHSNPPSP